MKFMIAAAAALILCACGFTPEGEALRRAVAGTGAMAADNALENVEWYMCEAASVGSIKRRYGATADLAKAYNRLCDRGSSAEIVAPGR
ncbi:MAG: hypothetical protein ACE5KF_12755 [Kiloniellaceae bacterium]